MRFARLGPPNAEVPVLVDGPTHYDLRGLTADIDGDFLSSEGPRRAAAALAEGALPVLAADGMRVAAPIGRPSAIYCIGMNYAAHAAESGSAPPEHLVMFMKAPNTIIGPFDEVEIPPGSVKTDWEVELGVVMGARASRLASPADAEPLIGGYLVANDLSERDWQLAVSGGQWSKGKSAPTFLPLGPVLVTADEVNPSNLLLRSWVNDEPRQDSSTADLIFGVTTIIHELSQYLTLEPGDLILTGTPEGVALSGRFPYLAAGDVMRLEVDGLGSQTQTCVQAVVR